MGQSGTQKTWEIDNPLSEESFLTQDIGVEKERTDAFLSLSLTASIFNPRS